MTIGLLTVLGCISLAALLFHRSRGEHPGALSRLALLHGVERMRGEMGGTAQVIATGGNASLVVDVARSIEKVDEHLRLDGLRMLYADAHPADGGVDTG